MGGCTQRDANTHLPDNCPAGESHSHVDLRVGLSMPLAAACFAQPCPPCHAG